MHWRQQYSLGLGRPQHRQLRSSERGRSGLHLLCCSNTTFVSRVRSGFQNKIQHKSLKPEQFACQWHAAISLGSLQLCRNELEIYTRREATCALVVAAMPLAMLLTNSIRPPGDSLATNLWRVWRSLNLGPPPRPAPQRSHRSAHPRSF